MQHPTISVVVTSYNRSNLICRAIDSVLAQKYSPPFEVIVVDDGSEDDTRRVLWHEYREKRHEDRIRFFFRTHYGMVATYHFAFSQCNGEFIAICDCDDYWINYYKLNSQYTAMMQVPEMGLCLTRVEVETKDVPAVYPPEDTPIKAVNANITYDNLLKGCADVYAQSFFFRKSELDKIDLGKFSRMNVWDFPIILEMIRHSKILCLDMYLAVYFKGEETVTQTRKRGRRLKYILGTYQIRWYFIIRHGCKFSTLLFLFYRFSRDIYAIIFNRWFK